MNYFSLKPDFTILGRYIPFNKSAEELIESTQRAGDEGFIMTPFYYWQEEQIKAIEKGFLIILEKYQLDAHFDNLLYLCLNQLDYIENVFIQLDNDYIFKKRSKELAQLLLFIQSTETRQYHSISFKSNTETVKVSDNELAAWLGETIKTAFQPGNHRYGFLGLEDMIMKTPEELQKVAEAKIKKPTGKPTSKQISDFCLLLKPYIEGESELTGVDVQFSDAELNFYFELLVLFQLLDPDSITSDPQDYLRTTLNNNKTH